MNTLLIVDDDVELCTLLTERLAEDGFALSAAHNGFDGLELACNGNYSLSSWTSCCPAWGESMCSNTCAHAPPYPF